MPLQPIDTTSQQPNGKIGDPAKTAFEKVNANDQFLLDQIATKAASGDIAGAVAAEAALRQSADTALGQADAEETLARQNADAALQGLLIGRNRLINGNFDIYQRGGSSNPGSINGEYFGPDRWNFAGLGAQGNWGLGNLNPASDIQDVSRYMGYSITTAGTAAWIGQKIESARTLAGGKATLSFWMRSPTSRKVGVRLLQSFGTGGSPSAAVNTEGGVITLTPNFTKYTVTFDVPSVLGKTFGTNLNDYLYLVFDMGGTGYGGALSGQTGLWEIAQVQLESGAVATKFDMRPQALELMLCQRYFWRQIWASTAARAMFAKYNATSAITWVTHPVPMRITPAISMNFVMVATPGGTSSGVAPSPQDQYQTSILGVIAGSAAVGTTGYFNAPSGADGIIDYNAEL